MKYGKNIILSYVSIAFLILIFNIDTAYSQKEITYTVTDINVFLYNKPRDPAEFRDLAAETLGDEVTIIFFSDNFVKVIIDDDEMIMTKRNDMYYSSHEILDSDEGFISLNITTKSVYYPEAFLQVNVIDPKDSIQEFLSLRGADKYREYGPSKIRDKLIVDENFRTEFIDYYINFFNEMSSKKGKMSKAYVVLHWDQDEEYRALPEEERTRILNSYFTGKFVDDTFFQLDETIQQEILQNFIKTNLPLSSEVSIKADSDDQDNSYYNHYIHYCLDDVVRLTILNNLRNNLNRIIFDPLISTKIIKTLIKKQF